jgi:serine protease
MIPSRIPVLVAALGCLALSWFTAGPAAAAEEYNPYAARERVAPAPERAIVLLRKSATAAAAKPGMTGVQARAAALASAADRAGVRMRNARSLGAGMEVVELAPATPGESLEDALARLRADPAVEFAEVDARMFPHRVPGDPGYAEQWFLQAPVPGPNGPTASAVDAASAWDTTTGSSSVVVAVLDTGVRFDHPDLGRVGDGGKLLPGYDFVGLDSGGAARIANDGDGWDPDPTDPGDWVSSSDRLLNTFAGCRVSDSSWHGTRVSGILAARTDNAEGIAGTGWDTRILPVRVLGKCGGNTSDIIAGMRWAAGLAQDGAPPNPTPARVLNLSLGGQGTCSRAYQVAIDEIVARGVLVLVSAGNDGALPDQPANCVGVASVTGVRHVGTKVGFANLGPGVTIAAPGGNCVNVGPGDACLYSLDTTTNLGGTVPTTSGYTGRVTDINVGTSFASPIVAGIAALMYAVNERLAPGKVIERLQTSALPFPVSSDATVPTCRVPVDFDDAQLAECNCTTQTCGAGLANAPGAVAAALRPVATVTGPVTANAGATVTLRGDGSSAANGRTVAAYAWTLVSGATSLVALDGAQTSFVAPGITSDVVVRLTVTDDAGRSDAVDTRVSIAGTTPPVTPPPPPVTPPVRPPTGSGGGGGGALDFAVLGLLLLAATALVRHRRV